MAIVVKTLDQMVDDVLNRIVASGIGYDDKSKSSVLRTIVEAIMSELDIQYYQLNYEYGALFIDSCNDDDLDRLVAILGVFREPATYCTTTVTLKRSTPVDHDIPIPKGKILSTRPNVLGVSYNFVVDNDYALVAGKTSIDVQVTAQDVGYISVPQHSLVIMSTPIMEIDTVDNINAFEGGSDKESDIALRARAKLALSKLGKATNDALKGAILDVPGVESVSILDMHRGLATTDAIVRCSSNPVPQETQDAILEAGLKAKASGVDLKILYADVVYVNTSITVTLGAGLTMNTSVKNSIGRAITAYCRSLNTGDPYIVKQMENRITDINGIVDMVTILPTANVAYSDSQIIRSGDITINGEVWVDNGQ